MNEHIEHTEHIHEPCVGTDNLIRCKTCGKILPDMEQLVAKVQSGSRARKVLEAIAVAGKYRAIGFNDGFVIYSKTTGNLTEEITARKATGREVEVFKKISSE